MFFHELVECPKYPQRSKMHDYTAETVVVRKAGDARRRLVLASAAIMAVAACAAGVASYSTKAAAAEPSVESMYHMWLGPNGLPLSPRKQRALLFQFCTTVIIPLRQRSARAPPNARLPASVHRARARGATARGAAAC